MLTAKIRHAERYYGLIVDMISAHVARDDGLAYLHFHLAARLTADLARARTYFRQAGWDWYDDQETDDAECRADRPPPQALVSYISRGVGGDIVRGDDGWTDEELAIIYQQLRGIPTTRPVGEFRKYVGELKAKRKVARFEDGVVDVVNKRARKAFVRRTSHLFTTAGFQILALKPHDFGSGEERPSWLVRGRPGISAADIEAAGYLTLINANNTNTNNTNNTANSESEPPLDPPESPPRPPPGLPSEARRPQSDLSCPW
ncbi:MAG TPA: hypothetical protein VM689_08165 [Aliidongia sp.]|nr:hypothetical protein [Aliidongia sp.]